MQNLINFRPMAMLVLTAGLLFQGLYGQQEKPAGVVPETQALVEEIRADLQAGKVTEEALSGVLQKIDELYARYADQKTEEVARVLLLKVVLYAEIIHNEEAAVATLGRIVKDMPGTPMAEKAGKIIEGLEIQNSLVPGKVFPGFAKNDLDGNPLSIEAYRGKVVLVDFWATWCSPCVASIPDILKIYQAQHDKGFDIIGISLDNSREDLEGFIDENKMSWRQYFDGRGWNNELAQRYGIHSIPSTFLLDRNGVIIGRDLESRELASAVAKAISAVSGSQVNP